MQNFTSITLFILTDFLLPKCYHYSIVFLDKIIFLDISDKVFSLSLPSSILFAIEFVLNHKVIFDYLFKSSYMPV